MFMGPKGTSALPAGMPQETARPSRGRRDTAKQAHVPGAAAPRSVFGAILRSERICLALVVLLGLSPRLVLLWAGGWVIDSDEAIVGLMAKHIAEGRPWPIFYYGQYYMGSAEAILAAALFTLFGVSAVCLKLVPLGFSLLHIALVYQLARRFTDRLGALAAALLCALGPSALVLWSTKARGGFIELVVIGTLALIWSVDLLRSAAPRPRNFFFLGALLGVGWWVNNQIIFYMLTIAAVFSYHFLRLFGFRSSLKFLLVSLAGFFVGSLPFWIVNLHPETFLATFHTLLGNQAPHHRGTLAHLAGFFQLALPILFGSRRFWSEVDVFPGASGLAYAAYAVSLLVFLLIWRVAAKRGLSAVKRAPFGLLALFCLVVPLLFSVSSFGWLSLAPRYLLPLYSVLFVIAGTAVSQLRQWGFWRLSALVFFSLLTVQIVSNYPGRIALPGQPIVSNGERVAKDHRPLIDWLRRKRYRHVHTNYWIGYRLAFETAEEVTFTRYGNPRTLRIADYERAELGGSAPTEELGRLVFVLVPGEAGALAEGLSRLGITFRQNFIGEYVVIDQLQPVSERGDELELDPRRIQSSSRQEWLQQMIDGDPGTRWGSGEPQHNSMFVEVTLALPTAVSGIDIDFGFFPHDAPRGLIVEGRQRDGQWCELADLSEPAHAAALNVGAISGNRSQWKLYFEPRELTAIRLLQTGSHPLFDWSIAELRVFGEKRLPSKN